MGSTSPKEGSYFLFNDYVEEVEEELSGSGIGYHLYILESSKLKMVGSYNKLEKKKSIVKYLNKNNIKHIFTPSVFHEGYRGIETCFGEEDEDIMHESCFEDKKYFEKKGIELEILTD